MITDKDYYEKGTAEQIYVDYENIVNVVKKGNRVFVDDGLISLIAEEIGKHVLKA